MRGGLVVAMALAATVAGGPVVASAERESTSSAEQTARVSGRVVDERGRPLSNFWSPMSRASGTTAPDADLQPDVTSQYASACKVIAALAEAGASLSDVVRTVVYVRDLSDLTALSAAHRNAFGPAEPASTIVEVGWLAPETALVEIEVTAVIG